MLLMIAISYWEGVDGCGDLGSESMHQLKCDNQVTGKFHHLIHFEGLLFFLLLLPFFYTKSLDFF